MLEGNIFICSSEGHISKSVYRPGKVGTTKTSQGGVPGRSFAQNGHPQYMKNVIKSLNMKGNVSQRTEYVIINHFLTPWSNLDHFEYPKLEFLRN